MIFWSWTGRSPVPVGMFSILATASYPRETWPKIVWCPFKPGGGRRGDKKLAAVGVGPAVGHG